MEQVHSQIFVTTDYTKFKDISGNRLKNKLHLKRLKSSIERGYLMTIIIVNENYEIIDGQHRFNILKELNYPIYYTIVTGYGLNEVHRLNEITKNWSIADYINGYAELGYKDYQMLIELSERYKIGTSNISQLLADRTVGSGVELKTTSMLKTGQYTISTYDSALEILDYIEVLADYYKGARRRGFIGAIAKVLKNKNFDKSEFVQKIKLQPNALMHCVTIDKYIELIEEIYNYKRSNKINLRF